MPSVKGPIAAPAERIWSFMSDVTRWHTWTPTIQRIDALDDPALAIGRRYRVKQPNLPSTIYVVTALTPGRGFIWQARTPGLRTIADHRITPGSPCIVELEFNYAGPAAFIARRVFASLTMRYLNTELEKLRTASESR